MKRTTIKIIASISGIYLIVLLGVLIITKPNKDNTNKFDNTNTNVVDSNSIPKETDDLSEFEKISVPTDNINQFRLHVSVILDETINDNQGVFILELKSREGDSLLFSDDKYNIVIKRDYNKSKEEFVYNAFINDIKVGKIVGETDIEQCLNNEDDCIVVDNEVVGAALPNTLVWIIDKDKMSLIWIKLPKGSIYHNNLLEFDDLESERFIEAYEWIDSNILELTAFYVLSMPDGYYRVSPRQIWQYNLQTKEYSLIKTLKD